MTSINENLESIQEKGIEAKVTKRTPLTKKKHKKTNEEIKDQSLYEIHKFYAH